MNIQHLQTNGKAQSTGALMRKVVDTYYLDMVEYAGCSAIQVFDILRKIPYRPDPKGTEALMRPLYTLSMRGYGGDCDCKAIAMASWAKLVGIPYRFVAIRRTGRKNLHHVATELYITTVHGSCWVFFDPTYSFNRWAEKRDEAERVYI
jgi:transglutaminase-like putative cysteine protease